MSSIFWLRTVTGRVSVFYAAMSIHGRRGEGMDQLLHHCAKIRMNRSSELEAQSARAVFLQAWRTRLSLAAVRMAYDHTSPAVATLLKEERFHRRVQAPKFWRAADILMAAGATDLRIPPFSQGGGGD